MRRAAEHTGIAQCPEAAMPSSSTDNVLPHRRTDASDDDQSSDEPEENGLSPSSDEDSDSEEGTGYAQFIDPDDESDQASDEDEEEEKKDEDEEDVLRQLNLDLHAKSYNFMPGMYQNEIQSLRSTYGKLKKMEVNHAGPRAKSEQALQIREERAKVERALRRAESQENERRRRELERSVKSDFKKENQRRVDAGLKPFFPKKQQLQEAILRKKFDHMVGSNESQSSAAMRKAMDRKRKKEAQKQKKSLDAALGGGPKVTKQDRAVLECAALR
ncbi:rRNA biogenesis protein rrp36 [Malassezia nana]|uniref:rRNA biogenesis protein RRP36 n=1 Tax=Malassezia nana TaxID=180528 RepID=A0AAF0EKW7_9BASI|nr:rRNA biogenesis protein rrp36 [Malassezia nana]